MKGINNSYKSIKNKKDYLKSDRTNEKVVIPVNLLQDIQSHPETVERSKPQMPIQVLKIDMEDGRVEDLVINSKEKLIKDCDNFANKHNLSSKFKENLVNFCKKEVDAVLYNSSQQKSQLRKNEVKSKKTLKNDLQKQKKNVTNNSNKNLKTMLDGIKQDPTPNLLSSNRLAANFEKKANSASRNEIFDRLWLDATQGKKFKDMIDYKKFESMYSFQPNSTKNLTSKDSVKNFQKLKRCLNNQSTNDFFKEITKDNNSYPLNKENKLDSRKLTQTSKKELTKTQRSFKSVDCNDLLFDKLTYTGIKSPSKVNLCLQMPKKTQTSSNLKKMLNTTNSHYFTSGSNHTLNDKNTNTSFNKTMYKNSRVNTITSMFPNSTNKNKELSLDLHNKSLMSAQQSKACWMKPEHSFKPSVKHDRSYDSSTPYERSQSRIRDRYTKNREYIYGVKMEDVNKKMNFMYANSIGDLEKNKSKKSLKQRNDKGNVVVIENKFSKVIALASQLAGNGNTIKVPKIDCLRSHSEFRSNSEMNAFSQTKSVTSINYLDTIINELGMNEIFEISAFDFIEFIKNKNLVEEAAQAYDQLVAIKNKGASININKSINNAMDEIRTIENQSEKEINTKNTFFSNSNSKIMKQKEFSTTQHSSHTRGMKESSSLKRGYTWKDGGIQEREVSIECQKANTITPRYQSLLEKTAFDNNNMSQRLNMR